MPGKHSDCCCCPNCTYRVELCCPCVCPAICVTHTPDDYGCEPQSTEFDWEDAISGYQGSLAGHDLYYFIERDPPAEGQERGPCKFKLRSESLGYPEGYEYEWEIPCDPYDEVPCTTCLALHTELSVPAEEYDECSGGLLTTDCVEWVTPTNCDNCHCLCECLCAFVTKDGISYSGKLCWDDYTLNRWTGTLTGLDQYGAEVSLDMRVEVDRWGDVCDHETDYDCDPYDDSCAINAYIESEAGDIAANWQKMGEPCELRAVNYSWHIERDPYNDEDDIEITIRCATCNEVCEQDTGVCDCDGSLMPRVMTLTFHTTSGRAVGLEGATLDLVWQPTEYHHPYLPWITLPGGDWMAYGRRCNVDWVWVMQCKTRPFNLFLVQGCEINGPPDTGEVPNVSGVNERMEQGSCNPIMLRFGQFEISISDFACPCGLTSDQDPEAEPGYFWIDVTE